MIDTKPPADPVPAPSTDLEPRPAYEPPRVVKRKAVTRATLFSGGSGPPGGPTPPLVSQG